MAAKKSSLRRRSLHVVIVLLVFYPIVVYIYSQSVNRATADDIVLRNIDDGLRYCFDVKAAIEELLELPEDSPIEQDHTLERLRYKLEGDAFERRLEGLLYRGGVTETLVRFTQIYDGDVRRLHWGQELPGKILDDVVVKRGERIDRAALRERVFQVTSRGTAPGTCRITLPLDLPGKRSCRLVVGLVSPNIGSYLGALSEKLSMRALRLSLFGTSLLALLAVYIVYLNDRTRELELKLEEEKRLAYVGTIAAGMAHEIRNPLSSVKMNIQMIEDRLSEFGETESKYLMNKVVRIHRETARLEESVNNFLAFARPKPLERRWANLNQAIDNVIEFLEPACMNDGIRIVRDYAPDLPQAYIDPDQLGQAVENLVRNAQQATGKDGIIEIYTGRHDDHLEIRVSDDGPGIPAEDQGNIFEIFFTTKEAGSGLGLTIVKQIAEAHGGGVSFDTIEKRGTTFTIGLPVREAH